MDREMITKNAIIGSIETEEFGEVINSERTYLAVSKMLRRYEHVIIAWTDQNGTHLDILLSLYVPRAGTGFQGGIKRDDLYVSVMRKGAFAFRRDHLKDGTTHHAYLAEKLGMSPSVTTEKLIELLTGICNQHFDR